MLIPNCRKESGDQLIKLDNENEYNYFKSKLKRIFYPDIVWHELIKIKAKIIIDLLDNFDLNECLAFAAKHVDKFNVISDKAVDCHHLDLISEERKKELVKLVIANNQNLAELLTEYNSDVIQEMCNYAEEFVKAHKIVRLERLQFNLNKLIMEISFLLNDELVKQLVNMHNNNLKLLGAFFKPSFSEVDTEHLYANLQQGKLFARKDELKAVMTAVKDLSYLELRGSKSKILYTNDDKGYQLILEESRIFLYTGKPFIAFNSKLKEELIELTHIEEDQFKQIKSSISSLVGGVGGQIGPFHKADKLNTKIRYLNNCIRIIQQVLDRTNKEVDSLIEKARSANEEIESIKNSLQYQEKVELEGELAALNKKLNAANEKLWDIPKYRASFAYGYNYFTY